MTFFATHNTATIDPKIYVQIRFIALRDSEFIVTQIVNNAL